MIAKLRPLSPPHKGLRHVWGLLSLNSGNCDLQEPYSIQRLQKCAQDLQCLCKDHETNEEQFIFKPLFQRTETDLRPWQHQHAELSELTGKLFEKILRALPSDAEELYKLHLEISATQARYLDLMYWEDTVIEPLMREHFTDQEMIEHQVSIMEKTSPETLLLWFQYIVPARQLSENIQVLKAYRDHVSHDAFDRVIEVLKHSMELQSYKNLLVAINEF